MQLVGNRVLPIFVEVPLMSSQQILQTSEGKVCFSVRTFLWHKLIACFFQGWRVLGQQCNIWQVRCLWKQELSFPCKPLTTQWPWDLMSGRQTTSTWQSLMPPSLRSTFLPWETRPSYRYGLLLQEFQAKNYEPSESTAWYLNFIHPTRARQKSHLSDKLLRG